MANKNVGTKKIKSRILESVHEDAKGLFAAGAIDKTTMREFDALCLPKIPDYTAKQIKSIRLRCNASLQKWEIGAKKPTGVALKLLSIIDDKGLDALI
jgi:putative transcriptional regulator